MAMAMAVVERERLAQLGRQAQAFRLAWDSQVLLDWPVEA